MSYQFGWNESAAPAANAAVRAQMAAMGLATDFGSAAPGLVGSGDGKTVLLHEAAKRALGTFLQSQYQPRGTCVSRGAKRIVDLTQCVQIALQNTTEEFHYVSHAYIYGTCREHGGDLSYEDGAVGAWAAWSVHNDGNLRNSDVGDDDNLDDLAVKWGAKGVPKDIKEKGKLHIIKAIAPCKSADDVRDAVCNLKGVTCASNVGFEPFKRDSEGRCKPGGSWPHQMCVTGYRADKDWFLIDQSWGPDSPGGPIGSIEIPSYSFWIDRAAMERIVRQDDTWVFAGLNGWAAAKLDWYA